MLGEVISTAGPNHTDCCDSYNFMAKFNSSSPLSNTFKQIHMQRIALKLKSQTTSTNFYGLLSHCYLIIKYHFSLKIIRDIMLVHA